MNDFSKATLRNLARKGISLLRTMTIPDENGSCTNGNVGYVLDDNGTVRVRTFFEVIQLAGSPFRRSK